MGKKLFEEEQEVIDAIQHREMASRRLNFELINKDCDGLITAEVMLSKSLEFECAKELIKGLVRIINTDQISVYSSKLRLTALELKLLMEAKKFIS